MRPVADFHVGTVERYRLVLDGTSLAEIAKSQGVTRQAVHDDLKNHIPWLLSLVQQRKAARARLRKWVAKGGVCPVCGDTFMGRPSYCSDKCYRIKTALRRVTSADEQARHQEMVRRGSGRTTPTYDHGSWPKRVQTRWLVHGSHIHGVATLAYQNNWPIVNRFDPQILAQLEQEAAVNV